MDDFLKNYDDGKSLPPVYFSIKELSPLEQPYTFTGWNTAADGSGNAFGDRDSQNITATDGETITLYANWDMAQITTSDLPEGRQGKP